MGTSNTISYSPPAIRLSRALLLLENTPGNVQLDEAARAVNLSSSRLRHLVRERLGISPSKYVKQVKLQRAKELLATTELSIKEVIWEAGFTDFSHAVRDYKRLHGETPSQTRERTRSVPELPPLISVS